MSTASATLSAGFTTYFSVPCPPGWASINDAQGRVVVSVGDASIAGLSVGTPLAAEEDRLHTHAFNGTFSLPSKHIAAIEGGGDSVGAESNTAFAFSGVTDASESGLPFVQYNLCRLQATDASLVVPFGAVGFYSSEVASCPGNTSVYAAAAGRTIVGGYIETGGAPFPSFDAPLASEEDRAHTHKFATTVVVPEVEYAAVDGCCNDKPAPSGTFPLYGTTAPASAGVPYIQLLTCFNSGEDTFDVRLPPGALLFSPLLGCAALKGGWTLAAASSGRFIVAMPAGGVPGATFGGDSLLPNATSEAGTTHTLAGAFRVGSDSLAILEGCCATGYAQSATVPLAARTGAEDAHFPYLMAALCQRA
jgi:hypothetical protein